MVKRGDHSADAELVCENCIKLEKRKRELQINVIDSVIEEESKISESIKEMRNELTVTRSKFNKEFYMEQIKKRAAALTKSIELLEKIEETDDEQYVEKYKNLFEDMKRKFT